MEEELSVRYLTSIERLAIKEGIQQGMQQGMQQGEARLLGKLLVQRFGELPPSVLERLASATEAQIEAWADAVLRSQTLEQVFDGSERH
jgi:hypothetical protein